jgi:ribonucleoside-diphosphate reductase alpha chain
MGTLNAVSSGGGGVEASAAAEVPSACSIDNPDCEACQ